MYKLTMFLMLLISSFAMGDPNLDLEQAIRTKDINGVKKAIREGANPRRVDHFDHTMIHIAAFHDFPAAIVELTRAGAYLDGVNQFRQTALHVAAMNGLVGVLDVLTQLGANPSMRDQLGRTPINVARHYQQVDAETLLYEAMATIRHLPGLLINPGQILLTLSSQSK